MIKRFTLSILIQFLFIGAYAQINTPTPGAELFDDSFLHEIRIENADTNTYINTKDYQSSHVIIDGHRVDTVGIKRKGNISGYPSTNKFGLKVKTNKYVKGKSYDGIKEFTLHMNYQDPSLLREKLTYDICQDMGLYSLRTSFAKVYINNVYWGLFTLVEGKDEMYKHVFNNRQADAIESVDFGNLCFISTDPADYNNPDRYELSNGDETTAWSRFSLMLDKANNTRNEAYVSTVSGHFNIEHFMTYQAINVFLMNHDSYIGFRGNQIYVYDEKVNKWQVTPWDFNASFGLWDTNNSTSTTFPMIPNKFSFYCIISKMNDIPELKTYYLNAMCRLKDQLGDTQKTFATIDGFKNQIKEAVYTDNRKVITNANFDLGVDFGNQRVFDEDVPSLKTFINDRLAVIEQGLIDENYTCPAPLGLNNLKTNSIEASIYPNPAQQVVHVNLPEASGSTLYHTVISNTMNQEVKKTTTDGETIYVDDLSSGVYHVTLSNESQKYHFRFIKK